MKLSRKARPNLKSETFNLSLQFNDVDVRQVLQKDFNEGKSVMPKDFWVELLGKFIAQVGVVNFPKPLSIWQSVGQWAFALAIRQNLIVADTEDGLYCVNGRKFKKQVDD